MCQHGIQDLFVVQFWVVQAQLGIRGAPLPKQGPWRQPGALDHLAQHTARRRSLEVLDNMWLRTRVADHGKHVAGRAARRVMVDDDVQRNTPVNDRQPMSKAAVRRVRRGHRSNPSPETSSVHPTGPSPRDTQSSGYVVASGPFPPATICADATTSCSVARSGAGPLHPRAAPQVRWIPAGEKWQASYHGPMQQVPRQQMSYPYIQYGRYVFDVNGVD